MFFLTLLTPFFVTYAAGLSNVFPNPSITLPLARHFNVSGVSNIVQADRARAQLLKTSTPNHARETKKRSVFPVPATNQAVSYTVEAGVGTPPTTYTLLVENESAVTWLGADKPYTRTNSSVDTGERVTIDADSDISITGEGFLDTVTLGSMIVPHQFIAVVNSFPNFGFDGALGLGSTDSDDISPPPPSTPSITGNAFAQGLLDDEEVGIFFQPATTLSGTTGELSFGGIDFGKINGMPHTVPITLTSPSNLFVGIDQEIIYGSSNVILQTTAGIVDAGTTLLLIASDAFARYKAVTGAALDPVTGLLKITPAQFTALQSLFFVIGGVRYEFTSNAQIWPRALNTAIGGNPGSVYLIVSDIGSSSGAGLDFVNGFVFMERFYTVYNSETPSFGIAETFFTFATTN